MRIAWHAALGLIPEGPAGDWLFARLKFFKDHGRLLSGAMRFNDVICRQKTAPGFPTPLHTLTTDKELAKAYIAEQVGHAHCVETLAILHTADEIHAFDFPAACAIKPTHSSGHVLIRRAGEPVDRTRIASWLEDDFYRRSREPQYRSLVPKIIVEPLVFDMDDAEDFRFFCYRGDVRVIQWEGHRSIAAGRLYDAGWTDLACAIGQTLAPQQRPRPACLDAMIAAARTLSAPFDFVRVDMFTDDRRFLIGELSHNHGNASEHFDPVDAEHRISRLIFSHPEPETA